jgi:hypothetical protein
MLGTVGPKKMVEGKTNYGEKDDESNLRCEWNLKVEANNRMTDHEPDGGDDREGGVCLI